MGDLAVLAPPRGGAALLGTSGASMGGHQRARSRNEKWGQPVRIPPSPQIDIVVTRSEAKPG